MKSIDTSITFSEYQEFRKWVEDKPGYWILVEGVPMPSPSPTRIHQKISKRLLLDLVRAVEQEGLGEVYDAPLDVKLSPNTVYQPDLIVVLQEHFDRLRPTHIEGAPDLVIEILSPATAKIDLFDKKYHYAGAGVFEYWIVDPDTSSIEIYVLESGALTLKFSARATGTAKSFLIRELVIDLSALFDNL
ncbi:Uma2 family endonuclease [bacterium]|nr:Uma2 family endonuclease [bacterium]